MTSRRDKGSGSLVDKGQGRYLLRVTHEGRTHNRQITAGSRTAAKQQLAAFAKDVRDGKVRDLDRTTTVEVVLREWLNKHRKMAPKTRIETERMIRLHLVPHLGDIPIGKLTPQQIDRCYRTMETEKRQRVLADGTIKQLPPLTASTVRRTHGVLSAGLAWAVRQDILAANPATRVDPPHPEQTSAAKLSSEHVLKLLGLAMEKQPKLGTFTLIAAASGARRGEVAGLRWRDVDWQASTLAIDSSVSYLGRAQGTIEKTTKTERPRRVAIDRRALVVLDAWHRATVAAMEKRGCELDDDCFVFARDPERREPPNPEGFSKAWKRLCVEAGHPDISLKALRSWLATAALDSGLSTSTVAAHMGHSPRVLERHYWDRTQVDARPAAVFGAVWGEQKELEA